MDNAINKLWKISLSLTSIHGFKYDFDVIEKFEPFWKRVYRGKMEITKEILQGVTASNSTFYGRKMNSGIESFLQKVFNISDEDGLRRCIAYLHNGSNIRASFGEKRNLLVLFSEKEKAVYIRSFDKHQDKHAKLMLID